jgi:hypothetical protein
LPDGCEPLRLISIVPFLPSIDAISFWYARAGPDPFAASAARPPLAASMRLRVIIMRSLRLIG